MKFINSFIVASAAIIALAGCHTEEPKDGITPSEGLTVNASVDGTIVTKWNASDKMTVVCGDEMYEFTTTQSGANAAFTDKNGILTAELVGENPVSAFVNCRTMFGAYAVSPEQNWSNGASSVAIPMYAYTMNAPIDNSLSLQFNPLASVIDLTIAPYGITVQSLKIKAAQDATISSGALAGVFKVDADNGTVSVTSEQNEIEVSFDGGMNLAQGATIQIPVGMCSVAGGLELTFIYDDAKEYIGTIFASDAAVKLYDDSDGFKKAARVSAAFEFDANAFPRTWFVAPGASASAAGLTADAPTTLSNALSTALAGSVIRLAAGTYTPDTVYPGAEGEMFKTFAVTRNLTLEGADGTILDGNGSALHTLLVYAPKVDGEKVILKNITVRNGASVAGDAENIITLETFDDGSALTIDGSYGSGITVVSSSVEIEDITVTENNGFNGSGFFAKGSDLVIRNSTFTGNKSGGNGGALWFSAGNDVLIEGCTISGNGSGGVAGGLYLHCPAETTLKAEVRNTLIKGNKSGDGQNAGGVYVRDDSGNHGLSFLFDGCTIDGNEGNMGASVLVLNGKGIFRECIIINNSAAGNGNFYVNTSGEASADVLFDGCEFRDNYSKGMAGGIYAYNNGGGLNIDIVNSAFAENVTDGRGGALYMRNNTTADLTLHCANTTFALNTSGSWGSAINLYGAATKKTIADIVSCTVTGNDGTKANYAGAVTCETVGTTFNIYNTIISGNTNNGNYVEVAIKSGVDATINHKCNFVGTEYYGADGIVADVTPAFDFTTMIKTYKDGVCALAGDASTNPAFTNGMTSVELQALAAGNVTSDILGKDQAGNVRSEKVMGAYVK